MPHWTLAWDGCSSNWVQTAGACRVLCGEMALREEAHESPVDTYLTLDDRRVNSQRTRPLPLQEENAHLRVQEVDTVLIVDGTGVEEQRNESGGKWCYRWSQGYPRGVFSPHHRRAHPDTQR